MRTILAALALACSLPTLAFATPSGARGFVASTPGQLRNAILASAPSYKKVPKNQYHSKKFQAFIGDPKNYTRIDLAAGLVGGVKTAYVAKKVYPNRVFVRTANVVAPQYQGPGTWTKGYAPRF